MKTIQFYYWHNVTLKDRVGLKCQNAYKVKYFVPCIKK